MASFEEIQAQLLGLADRFGEDIAGALQQAVDSINEGEQFAAETFEGTGRSELLEILGQITQLGINTSDCLIEALQIGGKLREASGLL